MAAATEIGSKSSGHRRDKNVNTRNDRLSILAQYKKTPPGFLEDRRSVYWVDKIPPKPPTHFALNKRQEELVRSKEYHKDFKPDRPSSIWPVKRAALLVEPSEKLNDLARPKPFHPDWIQMKSVYTTVPEAAMKMKPTERLKQLSHPKTYAPLPIKSDSEWDWSEWKISIPKTATSHIASARLEQLSEPKREATSYEGNRHVIWPVATSAMQCQASTRVHQLARPKTRQALDQDYDPYKVSFAARMAVPSPRVVDLALPIPRKIRTKKAV